MWTNLYILLLFESHGSFVYGNYIENSFFPISKRFIKSNYNLNGSVWSSIIKNKHNTIKCIVPFIKNYAPRVISSTNLHKENIQSIIRQKAIPSLQLYTLKKWSLLKTENNSSWVNITPSSTWIHFLQLKLASLHVHKIWY